MDPIKLFCHKDLPHRIAVDTPWSAQSLAGSSIAPTGAPPGDLSGLGLVDGIPHPSIVGVGVWYSVTCQTRGTGYYQFMKNLLIALGVSLVATFHFAYAESEEVTLTGTGMCGKCALKETEKCQNVLKVVEGETETTYFMTENMEHGKFFCRGKTEGLKVVGTVQELDGKMMLTPKSVEKVE